MVSSVESILSECKGFTYFCPYCGTNLHPKIIAECVYLVCPTSDCAAGFEYYGHSDFLKMVKSTIKRYVLHIPWSDDARHDVPFTPWSDNNLPF